MNVVEIHVIEMISRILCHNATIEIIHTVVRGEYRCETFSINRKFRYSGVRLFVRIRICFVRHRLLGGMDKFLGVI